MLPNSLRTIGGEHHTPGAGFGRYSGDFIMPRNNVEEEVEESSFSTPISVTMEGPNNGKMRTIKEVENSTHFEEEAKNLRGELSNWKAKVNGLEKEKSDLFGDNQKLAKFLKLMKAKVIEMEDEIKKLSSIAQEAHQKSQIYTNYDQGKNPYT